MNKNKTLFFALMKAGRWLNETSVYFLFYFGSWTFQVGLL